MVGQRVNMKAATQTLPFSVERPTARWLWSMSEKSGTSPRSGSSARLRQAQSSSAPETKDRRFKCNVLCRACFGRVSLLVRFMRVGARIAHAPRIDDAEASVSDCLAPG
jgi:hypothetical protein